MTLQDGFNVTSVALAGTNGITVTLAQDMADTNFAVVIGMGYSSDVAAPYSCRVVGKAAGEFSVYFYNAAGTMLTLSPTADAALDWDFVVFGKQTT